MKLSDDFKAELNALGAQNSESALEIGRKVHALIELCERKVPTQDGGTKIILVDPETEEPTTIHEICLECGKADAANLAPETIADYRSTARYVSRRIEKEFHMFGRHHWKAIVAHAKTDAEQRVLCNKILSWMDDYGGTMISVAALRIRLAAGNNGNRTRWAKEYKRACRACEKLKADDDAPAFIRSIAEKFLRASVPLP